MLNRNITPPQAVKKETVLTKFDVERIDPYFWLKDKNNQEVVDYLNAENAHTTAVMKNTESLQEQIFEEIKGKMKEDDESYPVFANGYFYFSSVSKGEQYRKYYRQKTLDAEKELLFDVNEMAKDFNAFIFSDYAISDDNTKCAYLFNTTGSYAEYTLKIKDLEKNADLDFSIDGIASMAWAADNKTLFFTKIDKTLRPCEVYRLSLDNPTEHTLVYREQDERFLCDVSDDKNLNYIIIEAQSSTSGETYLIDAHNPTSEPVLVVAREKDVEYGVYPHNKDTFFIRYKTKSTLNGEIFIASGENLHQKNKWEKFVEHCDQSLIEGIDVFENYVAVEFRRNGLIEIEVCNLQDDSKQKISFPEVVYDAGLSSNPEFKQSKIRYSYSALNRPSTLFEFDCETGESKTLKVQEIPSGFNSDDYVVERIWATSHDGVKVPYAVIYKKELAKDSNNPTLLYSYGSYGISSDLFFSPTFFSLIDRGFVFAKAQIRGGSDLGEQWYEDGKFLKKKNTFKDFIACGEDLIKQGFTNPQKLAVMGGSAGGLLMGAVVNMRPDLFKCVLSLVPFVDVVTTMLDDSLPLTTGEYEEWGNPNDKEYFDYMLSYSPYDNLQAVKYPDMFVSGGINDSQVLFHEPTKYVAKVRDLNTASSTIVLDMDMKSGHGGATGRYDSIKDYAKMMAFTIASLTE